MYRTLERGGGELAPKVASKTWTFSKLAIFYAWKFKTMFQPASRLEKLMEGLLGSLGGFGRKFPEGDLNFLEVALDQWKFPY